jgi:hypothetical protein
MLSSVFPSNVFVFWAAQSRTDETQQVLCLAVRQPINQDREDHFLALGDYFFLRLAFFLLAFPAVLLLAFFLAILKPPCN